MKVAFITVRVPYPVNSGGRIRTFHLLKAISRVHQVTLITALEGDADREALFALRERLPELTVQTVRVPLRNTTWRRLVRTGRNLFDFLPYTWASYRHSLFTAHVQGVLLKGAFDLIHCEQVHAAHTLKGCRTPPRLINASDVQWLILRRVAEQEPRRWKRALVMWQASKTLRAEREAYAAFDRCVAVSEFDRAQIQRLVPWLPVSVVPNGVDVAWFHPTRGSANPHVLVFTGAMDWLPNADGVMFFVRQVLPTIRKKVPQAELWVVGRAPSPELRRQLMQEGITVTGTVDDVRPYLSRASLVVVPLRIGGGTRLKILEAWAMSKAVLSTSIGAEGLPAVDGENIALADRPETMAERAVSLLGDPSECQRLGAAGRSLAQEQFAWERIASQLLEAYSETMIGSCASVEKVSCCRRIPEQPDAVVKGLCADQADIFAP